MVLESSVNESDVRDLLESGNYYFADSEFNGKMALMDKNGSRQVCLLNADDVLFLDQVKKGVIPSDFLSGQVEIYLPGNNVGDGENVAAVISFAEIAMGQMNCEKLSLGDLFFLIGMLMLSLSQFQREALGDAAIFDRQTLSEQVKQVFTLAVAVAKKQYDAAKQQAIAEIVMSCISIVGSAISLIQSFRAASKLKEAAPKIKELNGETAASGETDANKGLTPEKRAALEKEIDQIQRTSQTMSGWAQSLQQLLGAFGQVGKGITDLNAAGLKFEADMINATIEGLRQFLQVIQSKISSETQAYKDMSQMMQQTVEFVKKMADLLYNITHEIASHI